MRTYEATDRDNRLNIMRLELTGEDVEVLEGTADRLKLLAVIEEALDVKAVYSPFISGKDLPTVTQEGESLLRRIVRGWFGDDPFELTEEGEDE